MSTKDPSWSRFKESIKPLKQKTNRPEPKDEEIPFFEPDDVPFSVDCKSLDNLNHGNKTHMNKRLFDRLGKGTQSLDGKLDLHGYKMAEAQEIFQRFIKNGYFAKKRYLLVVTGKGHRSGGILRHSIKCWINLPENRPYILGFDYARQRHGGMGALYIVLKGKPL
jgi:DNA-nicking Smr family endonuclease